METLRRLLAVFLCLSAGVNAELRVPKFYSFSFEQNLASGENMPYCSANSTTLYSDVYGDLVLESQLLLSELQDAGGVQKLYRDFINSSRYLDEGEILPEVLETLINNSQVWDALQCCTHPTSYLEISHHFGCPRGVSECVYDRKMDKKSDLVALTPPAGCCPTESPNPCFARKSGGGLRGCCSDDKPTCCYAEADGKWLGCASDPVECCADKICPPGYTCCRGKRSGTVCCPRYGGSCFNNDYFAYGLDRPVKSMTREFYDDEDPSEQPKKLSEHFGLTYGFHGCLPIPGGEEGPVGRDMYVTDARESYADNFCEDQSAKTVHRIRPHVMRTARSPDDLDENNDPFYVFSNPDLDLDLLDLNISEEAQQFGGIGDLDFIECGKHLCYGERDRCVKRYLNKTKPVNHRVVDVSSTIEIYETLLEEAILNGTDLPDPINYEYLELINSTCHQYNTSYLEQLIADGIYSNLLTGEAVNPQFEYLLPFSCLLFDMEYEMEEFALGCCPKNSTPCASFPHSLVPDFPAEYPRLHSLFDPMYGCAMEGETCCGGTICPVGFKCCEVRFTVDGGFGAIRPRGDVIVPGHLTDLSLRPGLLFDILSNASVNDRSYMTGIFDTREHCCPEYSFCCQVDSTLEESGSHGRRFYFYCAADPLCKIPIWKDGLKGVGGGARIEARGYPSQFIEDDPELDLNSDGTFDYVSDVLEIFKHRYTEIYDSQESSSDGCSGLIHQNGSCLTSADCSLDAESVGQIMRCDQLAGTFAPVPPPSASRGVRAIGRSRGPQNGRRRREVGERTKRHIPNLSNYPPPPDPTIVVYELPDSTFFTINTTDIFSIASPLGNYFLRFRDYTEQIVLEAFFGLSFIGFPPGEN